MNKKSVIFAAAAAAGGFVAGYFLGSRGLTCDGCSFDDDFEEDEDFCEDCPGCDQ